MISMEQRKKGSMNYSNKLPKCSLTKAWNSILKTKMERLHSQFASKKTILLFLMCSCLKFHWMMTQRSSFRSKIKYWTFSSRICWNSWSTMTHLLLIQSILSTSKATLHYLHISSISVINVVPLLITFQTVWINNTSFTKTSLIFTKSPMRISSTSTQTPWNTLTTTLIWLPIRKPNMPNISSERSSWNPSLSSFIISSSMVQIQELLCRRHCTSEILTENKSSLRQKLLLQMRKHLHCNWLIRHLLEVL